MAADWRPQSKACDIVVYGHWNNVIVTAGGWPQPLMLGNTIGIDTIAWGVLTAVRLPDRRVFQSARYDSVGERLPERV